MTETFIDSSLNKFTSLSKKPEIFLSSPNGLINNIQDLIKGNYDFTKNEESTKVTEALPELIVKNFDLEQIWQQIELQNSELLLDSLTTVSRLVAAKDRLWFVNLNQTNNEAAIEDAENIDENGKQSGSENSNTEEQGESDIENNMERDQLYSSEHENGISKINPKNKKSKESVLDDEFFKLNEMEAFLKKEEQGLKCKKTDDDSDEESVDLFEANLEDLVDDSDQEDELQNNPKYYDFFGEGNQNKERKRFSDNNDENEFDESQLKSSFEQREERLKKRIEDLEEGALQDKPWQLKGEVTAENRPQNSLLEEVVEFDLTSRPAPVITEETTHRLEDIIKHRIKDKAWDDVERKVKPVDAPTEYKKKLVLDQEKSKQSLAQIYENEYLKQKEEALEINVDKAEDEPKEHLEIKTKMKKLFSKLDALSNFHFTPRSAAPELRIVNNLPAISIEEVAPLATSDAALLAPEEIIQKPKGDVIGKGERTHTDKNRERRHKKKKQKEHANDKVNKEQLMRPGLPEKYSKQKAAKLLEKVTKDKNIDKMDESTGAKGVKSSTAFFTQLQEEIKGRIKSKSKLQDNKNKPKFNAKKIKL